MSKDFNRRDMQLLAPERHKHIVIKTWLKIGRWHKLFTEQEFKVLIAEALNKTVLHEEFKHCLVGYLITYRKVYLVLKTTRIKKHKFLHLFYSTVRKLVERQIYRLNRGFEKKTKKDSLLHHEHLFEEFPLLNEYLVKLITGREVHLQYYSPHLERMKHLIKNYNFCSAIDYSGGTGPVIVSLIKPTEY